MCSRKSFLNMSPQTHEGRTPIDVPLMLHLIQLKLGSCLRTSAVDFNFGGWI